MARYFALVPAAGAGARFGGATPKQYLQANIRYEWSSNTMEAASPRAEKFHCM